MKLLDEPITDGYGHIRLAEDEHYFYECWPQGFNDRLIVIEKSDSSIWEYGWCFRKLGGAAVAASLAVWDPDTQDEPVGWHKRPGMNLRRAPRRHENPEYNQPRCVHGGYMDKPCERDPYCKREGQ